MAVCPQCQRFPTLEAEAELVDGPDMDGSGTTTAQVRVVKKCESCGTEIKEYTFELEGSAGMADDPGECAHEWEMGDTPDPEITERQQTHDRHGKLITRSRYRRAYTGVTLQVEATCLSCGVEGVALLEEETTNGSFDELV